MCSPVVLWTHPGEHPDPDIESRREQEAVHEQRDIFYLRSLLFISLSVSGDSVPPERPVDVRGNTHRVQEILMYNFPCILSDSSNEYLSWLISTKWGVLAE